MKKMRLHVDVGCNCLTSERRYTMAANLTEFAGLLKDKPFENFYGLRGLSAFILFNYMKEIQPSFVVEVGVWKGFSTWIIEKACPDARIICLDPITNFQDPRALNHDFIGPIYRKQSATYISEDFSCIDFKNEFKFERGLVFFDDHNNKLARLRQARDAGFEHILFDDNWPFRMTHDTFESNPEMKKRSLSECNVSTYEVMPPLWDVVLRKVNAEITVGGAGFSEDPKWDEIWNNREDYSFLTYIRLQGIN